MSIYDRVTDEARQDRDANQLNASDGPSPDEYADLAATPRPRDATPRPAACLCEYRQTYVLMGRLDLFACPKHDALALYMTYMTNTMPAAAADTPA